MSIREMVYPDYRAAVFEGGDIRLVFNTPASRLGPVHIVLTADDAEGFLAQIAKARDQSQAMLARESRSAAEGSLHSESVRGEV